MMGKRLWEDGPEIPFPKPGERDLAGGGTNWNASKVGPSPRQPSRGKVPKIDGWRLEHGIDPSQLPTTDEEEG